MKKKERRLYRMLDRKMGLDKGSTERIARSNPERKYAIISSAKRIAKK